MTEKKNKNHIGRRVGETPSSWKSGPDKKSHDIYIAWGKQKAQANYRKEEWNLTFEEYKELWWPLWEQRGRGSDNYCSIRIDNRLPWEIGNVVLTTRFAQLSRGKGLKKPRLKDNV